MLHVFALRENCSKFTVIKRKALSLREKTDGRDISEILF